MPVPLKINPVTNVRNPDEIASIVVSILDESA